MIGAFLRNVPRGLVTGTMKRNVLIVGLLPENIKRMQEGKPLALSAETHPFLPLDLEVIIFTGADAAAMIEELRQSGVINDQTTFIDLSKASKGGTA